MSTRTIRAWIGARNPGGERTADAYLEREYRRLGLEIAVWEELAGRSKVVGRSLKFSGQADTVFVGKRDDRQGGDPFSGRVETASSLMP